MAEEEGLEEERRPDSVVSAKDPAEKDPSSFENARKGKTVRTGGKSTANKRSGRVERKLNSPEHAHEDDATTADGNVVDGSEDSPTDRETETERGSGMKDGQKRKLNAHSATEKRRRDRITEKMEALKKMVPHQAKADKAAFLGDVISHIQQLHALLRQTMAIAQQAGHSRQSLGTSPTNFGNNFNPGPPQHRMAGQVQHLAPQGLTNAFIGQRQYSTPPGTSYDYTERMQSVYEGIGNQQHLQHLALVQQLQANQEHQLRNAPQGGGNPGSHGLSPLHVSPFDPSTLNFLNSFEGPSTGLAVLEGAPVHKTQPAHRGNPQPSFIPFVETNPWGHPLVGYQMSADATKERTPSPNVERNHEEARPRRRGR